MRHPSPTKYTYCPNVLALPQTFALVVPFWDLSLQITPHSTLSRSHRSHRESILRVDGRAFPGVWQLLVAFITSWSTRSKPLATIPFFCSSLETNMPIHVTGDNSRATIHRYNRYDNDMVGLFFFWSGEMLIGRQIHQTVQYTSSEYFIIS